jgi:pyridoxine kinase
VSVPRDVATAAARIGTARVIATGMPAGNGTLSTVLAEAGALWSVTTPRIDARPAGTGDLFTGLFAARLAKGMAARPAMEAAVAGTCEALKRTGRGTWQEMPIVAAVAAIVDPGEIIPAIRVS